MSRSIWLLLCLITFVPGCNRQANRGARRAEQSPMGTQAEALVNACQLLTSAEIEKIQGEPVQQRRANDQPKAAMPMLQCFFATPTASKSITVTVWQHVNGKLPGPREFWMERFRGQSGKNKDNEEEEEREKLRRQLVPVPNLGDEAFWSGTSIGSGSLYVLKGDCFFRIEIGGADDNKETRIRKTSALAETVLKHL